MGENFWKKRWVEQDTPWDLGGPHPLTEELVALAKDWGELPAKGRIWVPGCGSGHDAAHLARMGFDVVATDVVPEAIATAKATHGDELVTWLVDDALSSGLAADDCDGVFDRAMLLALPRDKRSGYLQETARVLKKGGVFMSIAFTKVTRSEAEGPPYAMSVGDLERLLRPYYDFLYGSEREDGAVNEVIKMELLGLWLVRKGS